MQSPNKASFLSSKNHSASSPWRCSNRWCRWGVTVMNFTKQINSWRWKMRPCSLVHRDFKIILALILWALTDGRKKLLSHIFADFKSKFLTVNPSKVFMFYSMPCPTRPWKQMIQSWHRLRRLQVTSTGTLDGPKPPEATYGNMGCWKS